MSRDINAAIKIIEDAQAGSTRISQADVAMAVEEVVKTTVDTYSRESGTYYGQRTAQPWDMDEYMIKSLMDLVRSRIASGELKPRSEKWKLLDIGAGYGRDVLRFSKESDVEPIALEHADGFVRTLQALQAKGELGPNSVVASDMRDMSVVPTANIECVRNHATLHHLPIVPYGLGADAAVAETRRVLVDGGVFYVLVKGGKGVKMIDTGEGLGARFYQLFTPQLLTDLLKRHTFSVVQIEKLIEPRPTSGNVDWVFALAIAV